MNSHYSVDDSYLSVGDSASADADLPVDNVDLTVGDSASADADSPCLRSEAAQPSLQHVGSASADAESPTACLEGCRMARANLGRVLVLGLGKSGKSVARYMVELLGSRVSAVFIAAGARNDDSVAFLESLARPGVEYAFGDDALDGFEEHFDLCIASPGIPYWHELYQGGLRLSDELISEVEFSWRESAADSVWVAITGTNGKTTTTSLAAHVLQSCGYAAAPVGNIGDVCLDAVRAGQTRVYVCEVSSYQLYTTRFFAPDVAVMLNITPDHLHWHKTLEAYRDAKFHMLDIMSGAVRPEAVAPNTAEAPAPRTGGAAAELARFARSNSPRSRSALSSSQPQRCSEPPLQGSKVVILDATNDVVRAKVRELKAQTREERGFDYVPLGTADGIQGDMRAKCGAENAAFVDAAGVLHVAIGGVEHELGCADDLQIKGEHNVSNALAAAAIAVALGAPDADIAAALATFKPLEHRIEPCGEVAGIACYNDSKATNVDATLVALKAFPGKRVAILLGGDDKGTDLADLVAATHQHAAVAVCFGAAGPRFTEAFQVAAGQAPDGFQLLQAEHLEDALDTALGACVSGDVVILSPACASFDEFKSFEQRGEVFKQLVAARSQVEA